MNKRELKKTFIQYIKSGLIEKKMDIYVAGSFGDSIIYPAVAVSVDGGVSELLGESGGLLDYNPLTEKKTVLFLYRIPITASVYSENQEESEDIGEMVADLIIEGKKPHCELVNIESVSRTVTRSPARMVSGRGGSEKKLWMTTVGITTTVKEIKEI